MPIKTCLVLDFALPDETAALNSLRHCYRIVCLRSDAAELMWMNVSLLFEIRLLNRSLEIDQGSRVIGSTAKKTCSMEAGGSDCRQLTS
jgi:hypothetical protein